MSRRSSTHKPEPRGRLRRALPLLLAACLVAGALWVAASAAGQSPPVQVTLPPTPPRVLRYNRFWYVFLFASTAWSFLGLWLLIRLRVGPRLRDGAARVTRQPLLQAVLCYAGVAFALLIWRRPPSLVAYLYERSYGFATLGPGRWLLDGLIGYLVGLAEMAPVVALGYWLLRRSPRRWWLWLWAGTAVLALFFVVIYPVFVDPLYSHFRPMPPSPLRSRLLALADRAGIHGADVYVVDISRRTTKLNAYVTGLGPTKRIVIWDTMLKALPDDEVVAIVGHEMGHYVLGHVWLGYLASVAGGFVLLWLLSRLLPWAFGRFGPGAGVRGLHDPAGLPIVLLVLSALLFLQEPAASAFSRWEEHQADRYGLRLTGLNVPMARAFVAFVQRDYADPDPPWLITFWTGTHPPLRERIAYALSYRR